MRPRILVTRPEHQTAALSRRLGEAGLTPVCVPTVEIDAESCVDEVDGALHTLDGAAWIVITSSNGAAALAGRIRTTGTAIPDGIRIAAVGPATARTLEAFGIGVDHVPDEFLTVAIADGLGELNGARVVLARADAATPELHDALVERGAHVEEVVAYRTIEGPASSRDALQAALHRGLDGLAFTSASTVRGFLRLTPPVDRGRARAVPAFCIGPPTAEVAARQGFNVVATALTHTSPGLGDVIAAHFAGVPS
jgi:uroporphyrinogen III methyltransferase/synthase